MTALEICPLSRTHSGPVWPELAHGPSMAKDSSRARIVEGMAVARHPRTDQNALLWKVIGDAPRKLREDTVPESARINTW